MGDSRGLLRGLSCVSGMDLEKKPTAYTHIKAMKSKGNLNDVSVKTDVEQRSCKMSTDRKQKLETESENCTGR